MEKIRLKTKLNKHFTLEHKTMYSSGYLCRLDYDHHCLELVMRSDDPVTDEGKTKQTLQSDPALPIGSHRMDKFMFKTLKPGEHLIKFIDYRPWEKNGEEIVREVMVSQI